MVRYVSGTTPFSVTPDALIDTFPARGYESCFGIWQISDEGELLYSTYFGGTYGTLRTSMDGMIFRDGKLYVAGVTNSHDFPLTPGAYIDSRPIHGGIAYPQPWGLFAFCIDFSQSTGVAETSEALPAAIILDAPYPNPFNPATTISFTLPEAGFARLSIYGINGQLVRELVSENLPAGRHEIVWDGRDSKGTNAGSGVYIARVIAGDKSAVRKMTLMR